MEKPNPNTTKGVPWADHNESESTPPDPRREEYGEQDADLSADERASERTHDIERETYEDRAERERD